MTHRFDNDVEFVGNISGGGAGNLVIGNAVSVNRRTPADVMNVNDTMFIKTEETGQHETALCTLISSTEMVRTRVIDRWDRTGALVTPIQSLNLTKVNFSTGQVYCAGTLPQPINIVLQPDGTFAYSDEVRKTLVFPLITGIQDPLSNILDGQIVFAANGLVNADGLGGLFLYDQDGDNGTINNVDIYAPGTVGAPRPGILIRQRMDIMAAFFRQDLSIYTPVGGTVVRRKVHSLARGVAGADDAWMGEVVQRGTDANGAYTDMIVTARDRQAAEAPYLRHRSYEAAARAFDMSEWLKPFKFATVATKADVKVGMCARVAADEKLYHNDPDRGLAQILLSDGGPRATVENIAGIRLLTPDGYQDNEVVVVDGSLFRSDGDSFLAYWSSGSSTADDGVSVFKPTLHASGAPWVEPGRFIAFTPVRAISFADSDATPSVKDGTVFTIAAVPPAGGYTNFDDFRNNKRIKIQPHATADATLVQGNGVLELPGRENFPVPSIASGGSPFYLEKENGVISMVGGGVSPSFIVSRFKELSGEVPALGELSRALQQKIITNTVVSGDWAAITAGLNAAIARAVSEGYKKVLCGSGHWHTSADARIDNPGVVIAGADRETTHFWKHGFNDFFRTLGTRPDVPGAGRLLASDTLTNSRTIALGAGGGAAFAAQTNALLVSEGLIQSDRPQKRGQFVTILSISGDTITLRDYARQDFTVANTARLVPLSLLRGVGYRDFTLHMDTTITPPDSTSYFELFGIDVRFCEDVLITNVDIRDTVGAGIYIHGCRNVRVRESYFKYFGSATSGSSSVVSIDGSPGFGYGVVTAGISEQVKVADTEAWALRHFFTTLETYGSETSTLAYGEPYNPVIEDCTHYDSRDAAFDTHNAGDGVEFVNCKAIGGYAGLQNRSPRTRVNGFHGADLMGPVVWNRGGEGLASTDTKGDYGTFENITGERTNLGTNHTGTIDFRPYGAFTDDAYGTFLGKHRFSNCGGPAILIGRNAVARGNHYALGMHEFPNRIDTTRKASIWLENAQTVANIEIEDIYTRTDSLTENLFHRQTELSGGNPIPVTINNLRGSGFSGRSFKFVGSDRGVTLINARGSQIRMRPSRVLVADDFTGVLTQNWTPFNGTAATAPSVPGGSRDARMRFTFGVDAAGTFAANGVALTSLTSPYRVEAGGLTALAYLFLNDTGLDDAAFFFGFRNSVSTNVMPFTLAAGDVLTANTITEGFGLLYDPAATTDQWALVAVKAGSVTGRLDFTGIAPVSLGLVQLGIEISTAGVARALINGVEVAEVADAMTTTNIGMALTLAGFNRSTNAVSADIDWVGAEQTRQ